MAVVNVVSPAVSAAVVAISYCIVSNRLLAVLGANYLEKPGVLAGLVTMLPESEANGAFDLSIRAVPAVIVILLAS